MLLLVADGSGVSRWVLRMKVQKGNNKKRLSFWRETNWGLSDGKRWSEFTQSGAPRDFIFEYAAKV